MAAHAPHRNRRTLFDQLVSMEWALDRFVMAKGPNKDFDYMKPDVKEAFEVLSKFVSKCRGAYENQLWDQASKDEKLGIFDKGKFPVNLRKKLDVVENYSKELDKKKI
jgi:hypothetical protein